MGDAELMADLRILSYLAKIPDGQKGDFCSERASGRAQRLFLEVCDLDRLGCPHALEIGRSTEYYSSVFETLYYLSDKFRETYLLATFGSDVILLFSG
jgi:hypothetical protein